MLWTPLDAVDDAVDATRCWGRCRRGGTLDGEVVEEKHKGNVVTGLYTCFVTVRLMLLQQLVVDVVTTMFRRFEKHYKCPNYSFSDCRKKV